MEPNTELNIQTATTLDMTDVPKDEAPLSPEARSEEEEPAGPIARAEANPSFPISRTRELGRDRKEGKT